MRALKNISILVTLAAAATHARAQLLLDPLTYQNGANGVTFQNGGTIPDGNPGGWSDTRTVQTANNKTIVSMVVSIFIDGGYNGDFYAYLRAPGGQISLLLNRVGSTSGNSFGYSNPGMDITLRDNAATDVHLYQTVSFSTDTSGRLLGAWQPDGRTDTLHVTDASARSAPLSIFNGTQPNGDWTLFVADMSGGEEGMIKSWGMQMTVVPEPSDWALFSVLGMIAFYGAARCFASARS